MELIRQLRVRTNTVDDDGISPSGVWVGNIPQNIADSCAVRICGGHTAIIILLFCFFIIIIIIFTVHRWQAL